MTKQKSLEVALRENTEQLALGMAALQNNRGILLEIKLFNRNIIILLIVILLLISLGLIGVITCLLQ
jgi:hypothetical protein